MTEFGDKVYVIVGGTGDIGQEVCERLYALGARIVIASRNGDKLTEQRGRFDGIETVEIDARQFDEVEGCFNRARERFGRVDGAVNCVGSIFLKAAHRTTQEEFCETVAINLNTAFATVRSAARSMIQEGGSIVLISTAAAQIGLSNHDAIAAAKAGIEGLTRAAAATYAARKVRINCVAPGLVETSLSKSVRAHETNRKYSLSLHPLDRFGQPSDVASAILFFLDPANSWVTGQCMPVDGGLSSIKG